MSIGEKKLFAFSVAQALWRSDKMCIVAIQRDRGLVYAE